MGKLEKGTYSYQEKKVKCHRFIFHFCNDDVSLSFLGNYKRPIRDEHSYSLELKQVGKKYCIRGGISPVRKYLWVCKNQSKIKERTFEGERLSSDQPYHVIMLLAEAITKL